MKPSGFLSEESVNPAQNLRGPENSNVQFTSKVILNSGNADNYVHRNWFPVLSGNCFCWQSCFKGGQRCTNSRNTPVHGGLRSCLVLQAGVLVHSLLSHK